MIFESQHLEDAMTGAALKRVQSPFL